MWLFWLTGLFDPIDVKMWRKWVLKSEDQTRKNQFAAWSRSDREFNQHEHSMLIDFYPTLLHFGNWKIFINPQRHFPPHSQPRCYYLHRFRTSSTFLITWEDHIIFCSHFIIQKFTPNFSIENKINWNMVTLMLRHISGNLHSLYLKLYNYSLYKSTWTSDFSFDKNWLKWFCLDINLW